MVLALGITSKLTRVILLFFLILVLGERNDRQAYARKRAKTAPTSVWPNATIPYVLDCSLENVADVKQVIREAMAEWEKRTCIRFVKRTNERSYLLLRRSKGCWGEVGYRPNEVTIISVGDGCEFKYVMLHELGHTIGFYHEHQRHDRDEFIEILWDNVMNSMIEQFHKRRKSKNVEDKLPYDISSIMHYEFVAFAKNVSQATIALRDKNSTEEHSPYRYISDLDVQKTHEMYNCPLGDHLKSQNKSKHSTSVRIKNKISTKNDITSETKSEAEFRDYDPDDGETKSEAEFRDYDIDDVVKVSLMSSGWIVEKKADRTASIIVNGKEMAKNKVGMNVVLFNYLSGRVVQSTVFSISSENEGKAFGLFIRHTAKRHYILVVGKLHSFYYLKEARLALKDAGVQLPSYIAPGSSICIIGYKGSENVPVKYVIGEANGTASFLSVNLPLATEYVCKNDVTRCKFYKKMGHCRKHARYFFKVCQKTCGACKKRETCEDRRRLCSDWAKNNMCHLNPSFMLRFCKVSCKICRKALRAGRETAPSVQGRDKARVKYVNAVGRRHASEGTGEVKKGYKRIVGKRCKDRRELCRHWAEHGRCQTDSWVKKNCLISCDIKGSCDREEIKPEGYCSEPFGIGWDQTLPDHAFSSSSFYRTDNWNASASNARLYMEDDFNLLRIGSWCAKYPPSKSEWLQIDLQEMKNITAVATQGRFRFYEHVKTYRLSFSKDGKEWKYYKEGRNAKVFTGNCDHVTPVLNVFKESVTARYIRFYPKSYGGGMCLRVEVYGCKA